MNTPQSDITHNTATHRFELREDGQTAYLEYAQIPEGVSFVHTVVPPALGGRGIGSRLAQHALHWARQQGLKVRPDCSFVRAFMDKHADYEDLRLSYK